MKSLFYLFVVLLLFSCSGNIKKEHVFIENRKGEESKEYLKVDTFSFSPNNEVLYESKVLKPELEVRNCKFPPASSSIGENIEYSIGKDQFISKILDKKQVVIDRKSYEIIKYNIDNVLSEDEESNKFFVVDLGVIVETYWRKTYLYSTHINGQQKDLLEKLIYEITIDEDFLWKQYKL